MTLDKESNVVNFTLSKDFQHQVYIRIHALKGITTSSLYDKIYNNSNDRPKTINEKKNFTEVLIKQKLQDFLAKTELITEIHLESGIGKKLTVPVIVGLLGEIERETCRLSYDSNNNEIYTDDKYIKFIPANTELQIQTKFTSSSNISSSSSYISNTTMSSSFNDNFEWIQLPIEYAKLPLEASLVFTNWCYDLKTDERILLNTGRINMFDVSCILRSGRATIELNSSLDQSKEFSNNEKIPKKDRVESLIEKIKLDSNRPAWLDKLTLAKLEEIELKNDFIEDIFGLKPELTIEFQNFNMPVVFSDIKYVPIVIPTYDPLNSVGNYDPKFNEITYTNTDCGLMKNNSTILYCTESIPFDPDQIRDEKMEDPIEQKFRRLERMQHLSPLDKELKPTLRMRETLSKIMVKQFFEKLTAKERNMVWRYRWFILNNLIIGNPGLNNAIINFVKCVDWNNSAETKEFEHILKNLKDNINIKSNVIIHKNNSSPIDIFIEKLQIIDCLELLSSNYKNPIVRNMAVKRLEYTTDSELSIFMVQLVQSIKNEVFSTENENPQKSAENYESGTGRSLSINNVDDEEENDLRPPTSTGNTSNYTIASSDYQMVDSDIKENNTDTTIVDFIDEILFKNKKVKNISLPEIRSKYINFIINRVIKDGSLTNYFYWCLKVELEEEKMRNKRTTFGNFTTTTTITKNDNKVGLVGKTIIQNNDQTTNSNALLVQKLHEFTMKKFILNLVESHNGKAKLYELRRQIELVNKLHDFCYKIKIEHRKESTPKKLELLKSMLIEKHKKTVFGSKYESRNNLLDDNRHESMIEFPRLALPLDPSVIVNGTFPDQSAVFKSSLNPLKITFKTINNGTYPIMYKIGDDLRQDQFVTQIISLMEKILESENMDLKLKPYKILATGQVEGFIQFIPNNSLSHILAKYNNSILAYLQTFNPDSTAHLGVNPQVMDNYVRSCAGYCVVTYILGVGDRHLENLLLSKDGHFFHADFGYILGQDPKPFPPLMKLPIQIIEGMGGSDDINYKTFCQYCFITYITLRKNASLILNLVQLMINTSIPALRTGIENSEAEKMELLWKVQEKFMLEMNDEEAVLHFQNLIDSSVNAVLPVVIDRLHNLAQYWRS
jgi:phosphatidylinositol 3-kinase